MLKVGRKLHTPLFTIVYSPEETFSASVVVGKKVYKQAVKRNRLRRQVYSVVSDIYTKKQIKGSLIVIIKPLASSLGRKKLLEDIQNSLNEFVK